MSSGGDAAAPAAEVIDPVKEQKMLAERFRIIEELLQTEYIYVQDLKNLVRAFYEPLAKDTELLPRDDFNIIFSNVKSILDFNETLYKDIRKALGTDPSESNKLAESFLILVQFLKMYSIYCQNRPNSIAAQERCRKKYPKFDKFIEEAQKEGTNGQTFDSFLVKPVQRICRYPMLFQGILKNTPKAHPDYDTIEKTLEKLQQVANDVNEFSKKKDNDDKLFELSLKLLEFPDGSINASGRLAVLERVDMDATTPSTGDKREPHNVFIFSDMLLFAKPKKKKLIFKHKIPLDKVSWRELEKSEEEDKWPLEITDSSWEGSPSVYVVWEITKIERTNFIRKLDEHATIMKNKSAAAAAVATSTAAPATPAAGASPAGTSSPASPSKSALLRVAPKKKTRSISVSSPKNEEAQPAPDSPATADKKNRRLSAGKLVQSSSSGSLNEDANSNPPSPPKRRGSGSLGTTIEEQDEDKKVEEEKKSSSSSRTKELSPLRARFPSGESTDDKRARMKRASSQGNFGVRDKLGSSGKGSLDLAAIPKLTPKSSSKASAKDSPKDSPKESSRESARESSRDSARDSARESSSSAHRRSTSNDDELEGSSKEKDKKPRDKEDSKDKEREKRKHHSREASSSSHKESPRSEDDSETDPKKLKAENLSLRTQLEEANKKNASLLEYVAEIEKQLSKIKSVLQPAK